MSHIRLVLEDLAVQIGGLVAVQVRDLQTIGKNVTLMAPEHLCCSFARDTGQSRSVGSGPFLQRQQDYIRDAVVLVKVAAGIQ